MGEGRHNAGNMKQIKTDLQKHQDEIRLVVQEYKVKFPQDYVSVKQWVAMRREQQATDYAEMKGADMIERALFEISDHLDYMFSTGLSKEAFQYIRSKAGARWFAKEYRDFSLTRKH